MANNPQKKPSRIYDAETFWLDEQRLVPSKSNEAGTGSSSDTKRKRPAANSVTEEVIHRIIERMKKI
jgi:hypothetical protein